MGEAKSAGLAVTLTIEQLRDLVREAVRAEMATVPTAGEVLDLGQCAELLGRHPKIVMKLVKTKGLPCSWISEREPRFFRAKVLGWLEERQAS